MGGIGAEKKVFRTGCVHDAPEFVAILADQLDFGVIAQSNVELFLKPLAELVDYLDEDLVFLC